MGWLETGIFEFHRNQGIKLAIEKQQVNVFLFFSDHDPILFLQKHKVLSKAKDKVAYILDYMPVENWLIAVFGLGIEVFGINEV